MDFKQICHKTLQFEDFVVSRNDLSPGRQNFDGTAIAEWLAFSVRQSLNVVLAVFMRLLFIKSRNSVGHVQSVFGL